eukprot:TRINITY_DN3798_c2_g1_i1.p1 TRINITY_DN3798_c2_g1~~TRINITY_DN3798_c2_g1_i1.p1  ORF type:complete len:486 (-),score=171.66 TRINITY_DN3798_c2_g1_i1:171-1628(-)
MQENQKMAELKSILNRAIVSLFKNIDFLKDSLSVNSVGEIAFQKESVQKLIDCRKLLESFPLLEGSIQKDVISTTSTDLKVLKFVQMVNGCLFEITKKIEEIKNFVERCQSTQSLISIGVTVRSIKSIFDMGSKTSKTTNDVEKSPNSNPNSNNTTPNLNRISKTLSRENSNTNISNNINSPTNSPTNKSINNLILNRDSNDEGSLSNSLPIPKIMIENKANNTTPINNTPPNNNNNVLNRNTKELALNNINNTNKINTPNINKPISPNNPNNNPQNPSPNKTRPTKDSNPFQPRSKENPNPYSPLNKSPSRSDLVKNSGRGGDGGKGDVGNIINNFNTSGINLNLNAPNNNTNINNIKKTPIVNNTSNNTSNNTTRSDPIRTEFNSSSDLSTSTDLSISDTQLNNSNGSLEIKSTPTETKTPNNDKENNPKKIVNLVNNLNQELDKKIFTKSDRIQSTPPNSLNTKQMDVGNSSLDSTDDKFSR